MIEIRPKTELGATTNDWLKALHHFRIGEYGNPMHQPIGSLVVWNDDEISPGSGFPQHGHADMEIITYVREGVIGHEDDLGNSGRIEAGDVQVMSAGRGIKHAEWNAYRGTTKVFQIWIKPRTTGREPTWGTKKFPKDGRAGRWIALASGYPEDSEALSLDNDARVLGATLLEGQSISYELGDRRAYLVPAMGTVVLSGHIITAGDGCAVGYETTLDLKAVEDAELVLVDIGDGR
jgi:quercetin 2,3-dioxygenase